MPKTKPKGERDKGREVFMRLRVEQYLELWAEFMAAGKPTADGPSSPEWDFTDETVNQVIYGLPIESLKDWKRRQEFLAGGLKRYYASRIEFTKDTECLSWFVGGEPTMKKWGPRSIIGNINGHTGGVQVIEKENGKLYFHIVSRTSFSESWDDVDPASVKITRETP